MLTKKQIEFLRKELETAKNPLFFYDGDGDGLTSFLLLYRMNREGKSYALKTTSKLNIDFMRKVNEFNPDKIFVLDIPLMTQEFVDAAKRPIFWIDHHPVQDLKNVHYFNPRIKDPDAYIPTSRMCWQVSANPDDLWIATAGSLADWHMPSFIEDFVKSYPKYLNKKKDLAKTVFKSKVGLLVKLFFFIQKGPTSEVFKSVKILSRIKYPDEIFKQTTAQGRFIFKRFSKINEKYEELLKEALKGVTRSKILLFFYNNDKWSFTANIANELQARYPKKHVIIARRNDGKVKCSFRGKNVRDVLEKALEEVDGSGGGHPDACGGVINENDWDQFMDNFKKGMK